MMELPGQAEVVVIGGGVMGASVAYHLALRGQKNVVLLEKQPFFGLGATGRCAGGIRYQFSTEINVRLSQLSLPMLERFEAETGQAIDLRWCGYLFLLTNERDVAAFRGNVALQNSLGVPTEWLSGDEVRRRLPQLAAEDVLAAAFHAGDGLADPHGVVAGYISAGRRLGVTALTETAVTRILTHNGRITGVETNQGVIACPVVVNAAGPWAKQVGALAGLDLPIDTWRHDTLFIRRPAALGPSHPTVIDMANSMYFRPETGGLTLVGLEDNNPIGLSPDGDADHAAPDFVDRAVERICRRIPQMEQGSLHSAHSGFDGITPDQRAILGAAGPEGFYLACGFSGTGFKIGPAVGACLAELIVAGAAKTVDISPFSLDRFASGSLLKGDHAYENVWH